MRKVCGRGGYCSIQRVGAWLVRERVRGDGLKPRTEVGFG